MALPATKPALRSGAAPSACKAGAYLAPNPVASRTQSAKGVLPLLTLRWSEADLPRVEGLSIASTPNGVVLRSPA